MVEKVYHFLNRSPINLKLCLAFVFLLLSTITFAKEKNTVLSISQNSSQYKNLSSSEKFLALSALRTIRDNLTLIDEIVIRTDENDALLRQIQKKSQIEASAGLAAVGSAYASDAGMKADVHIDFSLVKYKDSWKITYTASDIEKLTILFAGESSSFSLEQIEKEADRLSYSVLENLSKRNFISPVPFSVRSQLLHEAASDENFKKYIAEYEARAAMLQKQLEVLKKDARTAEERIKNENEKQSLRLKLEITERKKAILEAEERNRRTEAEQLKKRQSEIKELTEKQRADFEKSLSELENKRSEILKESARTLSLKKRIELIESDRESLLTLKNQIDLTVAESNAYYDGEKEKELAAKNAEGWRKADLSDGKPTDVAKEFRKAELAEITKKWDERKLAAENEIRTGVKETLRAYEKSFSRSLSELEATEFAFTSINRNENNIQLHIDEYDAAQESWTIHTNINFSDIPILSLPYNSMPDIQIRYEDMTGKKNPSGSNIAAYNEYRDNVEWADLYFRASVPYLYATLSLHVEYDEKQKVYRANYTTFTITKVENSQEIYRSGKNLLRSSAQGKHFLQNQKPRKGVFLDGAFGRSFLYNWQIGTRLAAFWGNSFLFAGGGVNLFRAKYAEQYSINFDSGTLVSFMALGGASVTIFKFRPYIEAGAGYYFSNSELKKETDDVKTPSGFCASFGLGSDYFLTKHVTIGAFYAVNYNYGCGFADSFGLRAGFNF